MSAQHQQRCLSLFLAVFLCLSLRFHTADCVVFSAGRLLTNTAVLLWIAALPVAAVDGLEYFASTLLHVYMRFGKWDQILGYAFPADAKLYSATTAALHYARAIAFGVRHFS